MYVLLLPFFECFERWKFIPNQNPHLHMRVTVWGEKWSPIYPLTVKKLTSTTVPLGIPPYLWWHAHQINQVRPIYEYLNARRIVHQNKRR